MVSQKKMSSLGGPTLKKLYFSQLAGLDALRAMKQSTQQQLQQLRLHTEEIRKENENLQALFSKYSIVM